METENHHSEQNKKHQLETIGLMASGIAHDFNNLLTSIVGQTSLALANLPPGNKARKHIERVEKAAEFGTSLTNQLLEFANDQKLAVEKTDINELILKNRPLFHMFLDINVQLVLDLEPDLPSLLIIRSQIQQVLMNIILNAAQAIGEDAGRIILRTKKSLISREGQPKLLNGRSLIPGKYIGIEIEDSGIGMDMVTLSKIFSPFYSTKNKGCGLGLSNCQQIIAQHNGGIVLSSTPKVGTKVAILLPSCLTLSAVQ